MSSFHFYRHSQFRIIPPGLYAPYKKPTQIFGNVLCPIFGKPSTPLCFLADRHGRKADLDWKLKLGNASDHADITQSQARGTRHRRMQEQTVCAQTADRFEPNTVLWAFHTIQSSSLYMVVLHR